MTVTWILQPCAYHALSVHFRTPERQSAVRAALANLTTTSIRPPLVFLAMLAATQHPVPPGVSRAQVGISMMTVTRLRRVFSAVQDPTLILMAAATMVQSRLPSTMQLLASALPGMALKGPTARRQRMPQIRRTPLTPPLERTAQRIMTIPLNSPGFLLSPSVSHVRPAERMLIVIRRQAAPRAMLASTRQAMRRAVRTAQPAQPMVTRILRRLA